MVLKKNLVRNHRVREKERVRRKTFSLPEPNPARLGFHTG
jgi:hypothetical protein